jgi:hypothetical protein
MLLGFAAHNAYAQEYSTEAEAIAVVETVVEEVTSVEPMMAPEPTSMQMYGMWFLLLTPALIAGIIVMIVIVVKRRRRHNDELAMLKEENARLQREAEIARLKEENERLRNNLK